MSAFIRALTNNKTNEDELGGQMSFLEHLDELRKRLIRSFIFVFLAASISWFFSDRIYSFLAVPVERALAEAQRRQVPIAGATGNETIAGLSSLKENDSGRYVFAQETKLGTSLIPAGASVTAKVLKDTQGKLGLFTDEALYAGNNGPGTILVIRQGLALRCSLRVGTFSSLANLGVRVARSISTREGLRNSFHCLVINFIRYRCGLCLLRDIPASC